MGMLQPCTFTGEKYFEIFILRLLQTWGVQEESGRVCEEVCYRGRPQGDWQGAKTFRKSLYFLDIDKVPKPLGSLYIFWTLTRYQNLRDTEWWIIICTPPYFRRISLPRPRVQCQTFPRTRQKTWNYNLSASLGLLASDFSPLWVFQTDGKCYCRCSQNGPKCTWYTVPWWWWDAQYSDVPSRIIFLDAKEAKFSGESTILAHSFFL